MTTRPSTAAALLVALLGLPACGDASGPAQDPAGPITALPRALTSVEVELVSAANQFGFDLLREVLAVEDGPNVVLSPLSASIALGMASNGAAGGTYAAISGALGYGDLDQDDVNTAYRELTELLLGLDPAVDFRIANSLWADEGLPFEASFVETVGEAFDASARTLDLQGPTTVEEINGWVAEETNGYIPKLLEEIGPQMVMFLINAIYFESSWTTRFDPDDTRSAPFRRTDGQEVQVQLMSRTDPEVAWTRGEGYVAVELPYGGEAFGMLVILPNEGTSVRDLVAGFSAADLAALEASLSQQELSRLALPRFELSYGAVLNGALEAMGMGVAFDESAADFSRMSSEARLFIDELRQKSFIEVDEAGTRAAAATSVGVGVTSLPPEFVADRPFLFLLRERLSGTVLFAGMVGDPTVKE